MTHWSKNGSKMMTSSPGSMNAMKALSIPSLAPVVMVTSVSGSMVRPKNGEYALAIAFFNRGRPYSWPVRRLILTSGSQLTLVGEYWLQSTLFKASLAASVTNFGGL